MKWMRYHSIMKINKISPKFTPLEEYTYAKNRWTKT